MSLKKICIRCVMDGSAIDIRFDDHGFCNFCTNFLASIERRGIDSSISHRDQLINSIKQDGQGREYDCIVGISGGVDSSYVLLQAVRSGLRPLAVHLDNGWNSELAVDNIANLIRTLKVDLYTHVINWEENRDLQKSFFNAHVLDIELLMDNAMLALNYQIAKKYKLHFILAGTNRSTEGMRMPQNWNWLKFDKRNIKKIHKKFGSIPIKTHPLISVFDFVRYEFFHKIHWTPFLDYFSFKKANALEELRHEVGYRPYPYKHYESIFTRFYQGYILPRKFGIDKRRLHLSTLIVTGQLSRDEALSELSCSPYPEDLQMKQDREFIIKKLGFTDETFDAYMAAPGVSHATYGSEKLQWDFLKQIHKILGFKQE